MKSLMLLNPRRRRRSKPARSTPRRKVGARRRRTVRAVRTRRVRTVRAVRRVSRRIRRTRRVIATRGRVTIRVNPRRRARRNSYAVARRIRRNPMRRSGGGSGGNLLTSLKNMASKENLTIAGGAIAASVLTTQVMGRFGSKLPLLNSPNTGTRNIGVVLYDIGLPLLAAYVIRRQSPNLAKGMVIAGLVNGINDVLRVYAGGLYGQLYSPPVTPATAGTGAYLKYQNVPNVLPVGALPPGYSAVKDMSNVRPMNGALDNSRAFPSDAWQ